MNNKLFIFLAIVAFTFGYAAYEAMKLENKLQNSVSQIVIKEIPKDLTFLDFESGQRYDLRDNDKVKTLVHFWATWCAPCEVEFPELVELINSMKDRNDLRFAIVSVNDDDKKVKKFLSKFEFKNKNVVLLKDSENNYQKFGTYKLPESFLFNSNSQTLRKFEGQQAWSQNTIVNYFNSL